MAVVILLLTIGAAMGQQTGGNSENTAVVAKDELEIGDMAIDFTLKDVNGKEVSLSSFRKKYVLIDFWASWCGPCRNDLPWTVDAYKNNKDKGFEVLAVSLDDNEKAWKDAIEKDGLIFTNVIDLKAKRSDVARAYGVMSIPQNFLIDPSGKIIAINLVRKRLTNKIAELFKDK